MTRMTGPDCVVMCNLINAYIHTTLSTSNSSIDTLYSNDSIDRARGGTDRLTSDGAGHVGQ